MRMVHVVLALCVVVMAGCGGEDATTPEADGAKGILGQKGAAVSSLDHTKIQNAVTHYQVGTGKFPASLDDLVPDYLPVLPKKGDGSAYSYDSSTGKVGP